MPLHQGEIRLFGFQNRARNWLFVIRKKYVKMIMTYKNDIHLQYKNKVYENSIIKNRRFNIRRN